MKLHAQTIAMAERNYKTKAAAYFYGLAAGYLTGVVSFTFLAALLVWFTRGAR